MQWALKISVLSDGSSWSYSDGKKEKRINRFVQILLRKKLQALV